MGIPIKYWYISRRHLVYTKLVSKFEIPYQPYYHTIPSQYTNGIYHTMVRHRCAFSLYGGLSSSCLFVYSTRLSIILSIKKRLNSLKGLYISMFEGRFGELWLS